MSIMNIQGTNAEELFAKRLITISAGILALLHLLVPGFRVDTVGLVLILVALSPWVIPFVREHVKSGEVFGLKFELLQKAVENQGEETKRQWDAISKQQEIVNMLVIYSLCDQAYHILYGISSMPEYKYHNDDNFRRWMYVLLDTGLIEPKSPGGWLNFDASLDEKNMVEFAKPTPAGEFLISLRGAPNKTG
jgi:hypothetical protein